MSGAGEQRQGHNSDTPAAKEFRAFVERIERLHEERKSIGNDIADLFKEMAGKGYDKEAAKTVIKIRAADNGLETWTARSHVVDTYLAALGMLPDEAPRAPAHSARENIEQFDAETGELADDQEPCDCADRAPVGEYYLCPKCDAEWPPEEDEEESVHSQDAAVVSAPAASASDEIASANTHSVEPPPPGETEQTGAAIPPPAAPVEPFEPPAFLRKDAVPVDVHSPEFILKIRPFCQDPGPNCHGHGKDCAVCKSRAAA